MILVDVARGSFELESLVTRQGIACKKEPLAYGDAAFEGNGPEGQVLIGVERKRLQDVLNCIDDGRLAGHQIVGMRKMYHFQFVIVEGSWKPHTPSGLMQEEHVKADGKVFWSYERPNGRVMYAKLRRYLFSVAMSGIIVLFSRDIAHTAYDICELYHWFQKQWRDHKSMLQLHQGYAWQYDTQRTDDLVHIPHLDGKPPLVRRWAAELEGIGAKKSADAQRVFRTPLSLAISEEEEWLEIPGVGQKTAKDIVRQITGG